MRLFQAINNCLEKDINNGSSLPTDYTITFNNDEEGQYMPTYKGVILGNPTIFDCGEIAGGSRYNYITGAIKECWDHCLV